MAYAHHERLSALDLSFLVMEDGRAHMHIGSVATYEAGPLRSASGGLDFERILDFIEAQLHKYPRYRQRLEWVPGFEHPVWVDDASFNLRFHVRHTALPPPGDIRQLKRMAGRILSQEFDRAKPLWEDWIVDGLEGDRFALISKLHHCVADGITAAAMGNVLVGSDPDYQPPPRREWIPRPVPTGGQLFADELRHRLSAPWSMLRSRGKERPRTPDPSARAGDPLRGLVDGVAGLAGGASETPLNVPVGPHRRFDWARLPFEGVHAVGTRAGGTVNDVVLAVASGALRSFLLKRGFGVDDVEYRAVVPVSLRDLGRPGSAGNLVSGLIARLPLEEANPWKRLLLVIETTRELKGSGFSGAGALVTRLVDLLPTQLLGPLFRRAARSSAANIVITNVPGPRKPVYLLGARQLECYPVVPLAPTQAPGIALLSYDGGLYWGLNADWDAVPDLHDLAEDIVTGFEDLQRAAMPDAPPPTTSTEADA